jgi:hypothetical protein
MTPQALAPRQFLSRQCSNRSCVERAKMAVNCLLLGIADLSRRDLFACGVIPVGDSVGFPISLSPFVFVCGYCVKRDSRLICRTWSIQFLASA